MKIRTILASETSWRALLCALGPLPETSFWLHGRFARRKGR